jgi:hypothetical protein
MKQYRKTLKTSDHFFATLKKEDHFSSLNRMRLFNVLSFLEA